MRIGAAYVPVVRRSPVVAGGGTPAAQPTSTPLPEPSQGSGLDLKAMGLKVQNFLSNLWDTVIGPLIKSLFGMFGG